MAKSEATLIIKIKQVGTKALNAIKSGLSGIKTAATIAVGALATFTGATVALADKASKFDEVAKSFRNLALSQGQDSREMLKNIRELSAGTITDMELMQQANSAMMLGLPVERFGDMLKIARSSAKATGQSMEFMLNSIVTGLGRGSKLMLDNLGIMIDTNKAYEKFAEANQIVGRELTDAEKKQAFINEALAIGAKNAEDAGAGTLSLADKFQQLKVRGENLTVSIGDRLAPAMRFFMKAASKVFDNIESWVQSSQALDFFQTLTKGVNGLKLGIETLGATLGIGLAAAFESVKAAASLNFGQAKDILSTAMDEAGELILEKKTEFQEQNQEIDNLFAMQRKAEREKETKSIQDEELKRAQQKKRLRQAEEKEKAKELAAKNYWNNQVKQMEVARNTDEFKNRQATLSKIATLQSSSNKSIAALGKAAAITQIAIDTPLAVGRALAAFPPPFNFAAAAVVGAAMAAQAAKVSGIALAEGGIVPASSGGTQATIGEGGRDEAVIPLPDNFDPDEGGGLGGNITINVSGGMLGDENSAREFAIVVDQELRKLRENNESTAFEEGLI